MDVDIRASFQAQSRWQRQHDLSAYNVGPRSHVGRVCSGIWIACTATVHAVAPVPYAARKWWICADISWRSTTHTGRFLASNVKPYSLPAPALTNTSTAPTITDDRSRALHAKTHSPHVPASVAISTVSTRTVADSNVYAAPNRTCQNAPWRTMSYASIASTLL